MNKLKIGDVVRIRQEALKWHVENSGVHRVSSKEHHTLEQAKEWSIKTYAYFSKDPLIGVVERFGDKDQDYPGENFVKVVFKNVIGEDSCYFSEKDLRKVKDLGFKVGDRVKYKYPEFSNYTNYQDQAWCEKDKIYTVACVYNEGDVDYLDFEENGGDKGESAACFVKMTKKKKQPKPKLNNNIPIVTLVQADLADRMLKGIETYGTPLQPHNGRDALLDAYEEALDMACYLRQALEERK